MRYKYIPNIKKTLNKYTLEKIKQFDLKVKVVK